MQTIAAGEFKAKCLQLMNTVKENNESFIVTKRGVPIAKLSPIEVSHSPFGVFKGTVLYSEDLSEISIDEKWEADES